jgi:hypothetical protein
LYRAPVEIGGRFYDGFRFTVPRDGSCDLVWAFRGNEARFDSWFIQPMIGGMKVGFEDWYHVASQSDADSPGNGRLVMQFLSGRKLDPGREYLIWFGGDSAGLTEIEVTQRFTEPGTVDPNRPETVAAALGIGSESVLGYHRHYCLGVMR